MSEHALDGPGLRFVPLSEFVEVDEPGAEALLGDSDDVLIPQGGDVMVYGDGGAGKTTLCVDLAFHLAAGDDWCGVEIPKAVRVAIVENEGPRPLFRQKLRRKAEAWRGSDIGDRLLVLDHPWAAFTFADPAHRAWLAEAIVSFGVGIVFIGPLTRIGMNQAGTLQETRDFASLLADVRARAERPVTFAVVHHENKSGQVSGAWEGAGDLLLHVQAQGHGRTRLLVQKARWSSHWHGRSLQLLWADGESFTVAADAALDADEIADRILDAVRTKGGRSWNAIESAVGGNATKAKEVRDRLLEGGRLIDGNKDAKTKVLALWHAEDPAVPRFQNHLEPPEPPGVGGDDRSSGSPVPALIRNRETLEPPTTPPAPVPTGSAADPFSVFEHEPGWAE